jgi:peflin
MHQQYSSHSPARTPQPPDPGSAELGSIFQAANVSRTGHLTTTELGSALVNGDYTPFDPSTNQALMRMFSTSPPGQPQGLTLTYPEFQNLWAFLAAWKDLFEKFDEDRSGRISLTEFSNALVAFGYRLSQPFVGLLYQTYNDKGMRIANERRGSRGAPQKEGMSFDLFVQACVHLKRMTDVFKNYDEDRDGYITVSFEEFLTEILKLRD